jgi:hypothetical protein
MFSRKRKRSATAGQASRDEYVSVVASQKRYRVDPSSGSLDEWVGGYLKIEADQSLHIMGSHTCKALLVSPMTGHSMSRSTSTMLRVCVIPASVKNKLSGYASEHRIGWLESTSCRLIARKGLAWAQKDTLSVACSFLGHQWRVIRGRLARDWSTACEIDGQGMPSKTTGSLAGRSRKRQRCLQTGGL